MPASKPRLTNAEHHRDIMNNTFLFYDIETTGLSKAFDQILQFAAIRTDMELRELERHEIKIKLSADVVPTPRATLTHQISIVEMQQGLPEIEAITKIHKLVNTPGTISLGYNTLNFDDEFLRFSFYRNLLPPYTHQYANRCGRADLYPMVIMYYLYKNPIIEWPTVNNKVSFKLEHLNQANHFTMGAAHNAMVDVVATLELAKKLKTDQEMWHYLLGYFNKTTASERMTQLETLCIDKQNYHQGLIIDGSFGAEQYFQSPVMGLGPHNHYKNKTVWLRMDKPELRETTQDTIAKTTWAIGKKVNETGLLLPLTARFNQYLTPERQEIYRDNLAWLTKNFSMLQQISHYHREYKYPKIPHLDTDAALYDIGFFSDQDNYLCQQFHFATLESKAMLLERFNNPILREQAIRILGRHYPEFLPEQYREEFQAHLARINMPDNETVPLDYRGEKHLTPKAALLQIDELRKNNTLSQTQMTLLQDLESYLLLKQTTERQTTG